MSSLSARTKKTAQQTDNEDIVPPSLLTMKLPIFNYEDTKNAKLTGAVLSVLVV